MVWFSCSAVGCEAKAERLVDGRLSGGHDTAYLNADQLPEGWWRGSAIGVEATDRQRTFCPEHSPRKAGT